MQTWIKSVSQGSEGSGARGCNNAGKFEGEDGLGSPASAPNLPTRFSVGTRHNQIAIIYANLYYDLIKQVFKYKAYTIIVI